MARANTAIRRRRKRTKIKKQNSSIYIGVICFILISIYFFGYISISLMRYKPIAIEEVKYGNIEIHNNITGVIIRDEYIIKSPVDGNVTYYYNEGEKVKKDAVVCTIKDPKTSNDLQEQINTYDSEIMKMQDKRTEISLFQFEEDVKNRNNNIKSLVSNYISSGLDIRVNNLYSFKNQLEGEIDLRSQMILGENSGSTGSLVENKLKYEEELKKSMNKVLAPTSGIVSFMLDNIENDKNIFSIEMMELLQPNQVSMKFEQMETLNPDTIEADKPIFKIISSDEWYIASYISNAISKSWMVGDKKTLIFKNHDNTLQNKTLEFNIRNIIQHDDKNLVIFSSTRNVSDFINTRNIDFEVESKSYNGLKIPNSAIVNKTFLKIPMNCVIDDSDKTSVRKVKEEGDILVPINISFKDETETYAYVIQDFSSDSLKINDKILKNGTQREEYIIKDVETSTGVYVGNRGMTELRSVEIIMSNEEYSIVKPDKKDSIEVYDIIISDAKNISQDQAINNK